MEKIFVDTSAFYALINKKDNFHNKAKEYINSIINKINDKKLILITTDYVLCESVNLINMRQGHQKAVDFLNSIEDSKYFLVENLKDSDKKKSINILKSNNEDYSLTDCTSFIFMQKNKIQKAFAFDRHFEKFGFNLID